MTWIFAQSPAPLVFPMCTSAWTSRDTSGNATGRYWCTREQGHGGTIHHSKPHYHHAGVAVMDYAGVQWPMTERERDESQR